MACTDDERDVGERIGEHLLDLIAGGDGPPGFEERDIASNDGGPTWHKVTFNKAF
ncbi:hypothetical protein ACRAWD_30775 [Caulobacter segnis]